MTIKILEVGNTIELVSPYHPDLPAAAKAIGGKWTGDCWKFDLRDEQRVRKIACDIYGYGEETITVRYTVDGSERGHDNKSLVKFGRIIAERRARDDAVRLGEGVIIISGKFPSSGGSSKYPSVTGRMTGIVVLEVRDVPVNLVDADDPLVEVVDNIPEQNPLATFTDEQLLFEVNRRGLK